MILCGIFFSSFFTQDAVATNYKNLATIHADGPHQGNHDYHKSLIYSEIENESEDSEQKLSSEIKFDAFQNTILENKYIKNILRLFVFTFYSNNNTNESTPVFIINRSIRI